MKTQTMQSEKKTITAILEGTHKDHCLFVGPWEVYKHTLSEDIKSLFTFIGLDYYFCRDRASKNESMTLARNQLIWFYHRSIESLAEKTSIGSQIYLIAPSALGFVALEYARIFPAKVKGVILIGMPDDLNGIERKQSDFFKNYNPRFFKMFQSPRSFHNKWEANRKNVREYGYKVNDMNESELGRYIAELKRDEEKYYRNMDKEGKFDNTLAQHMYQPWEEVNIDFRNYFFKNFMSDFNAKNIRQVDVPVFAAIGLYDGMAPAYLIPDMIEKGQLSQNFSYYIFNESAHMPQYEQPEEFAKQVNQWKNTISNNDNEITKQPNLSIRSHL